MNTSTGQRKKKLMRFWWSVVDKSSYSSRLTSNMCYTFSMKFLFLSVDCCCVGLQERSEAKQCERRLRLFLSVSLLVWWRFRFRLWSRIVDKPRQKFATDRVLPKYHLHHWLMMPSCDKCTIACTASSTVMYAVKHGRKWSGLNMRWKIDKNFRCRVRVEKYKYAITANSTASGVRPHHRLDFSGYELPLPGGISNFTSTQSHHGLPL